MYCKHPSFENPKNERATIWRFLDLPKFMAIIYNRSLHFSRLDLLGDPWEYKYSTPAETAIFRHFKALNHTDEAALYMATLEYRKNIDQYFATCWYESDHESNFMWKIYSLENQGIAIKSNYSRFLACFDEAQEEIEIGKVKYIDFGRDSMPIGNGFDPAIYKRNFFKDEKEIRAIYWSKAKANSDLRPNSDGLKGINIRINIEMLIDKIVIGPWTPPWYTDLVTKVLEKENLKIEVERSIL